LKKNIGGRVWSELKGAHSEERPFLIDGSRVPDFFDHWIDEYTSKVAADQPGTGEQAAEHTEKAEADGKDTARNKERER
jgi:hypothetical protein